MYTRLVFDILVQRGMLTAMAQPTSSPALVASSVGGGICSGGCTQCRPDAYADTLIGSSLELHLCSARCYSVRGWSLRRLVALILLASSSCVC